MIVELKKQEELEREVQEQERLESSHDDKNIITSAMEKIGLLEKKVEEEKEEKKSLNQRIEDLVLQMEKANRIVKREFSFKRIFLRGLLQGLGIVIGSTILAGTLYSLAVKLGWKDIIKKNTLEYILDKEKE